jgi:subtilisin family serine protease
MLYPLKRAAATAAAALLTALTAATPAAVAAEGPGGPVLDGSGECTFPMKEQIAGTPWPLQRVLLDELWQDTKGKGIRVAVIDTGVDNDNVQLKPAVDASAGKDLLKPDKKNSDEKRGKTDGTVDLVGHGTKVAGIIAARPRKGTGFVGIAPESTIIPIRQNDENNSGNDRTMATAIDHAIAKGADVINISQDTVKPLGPDWRSARRCSGRSPRASWSSRRPATTAWTARSRTPIPPLFRVSWRWPPPTGTTSGRSSPRPVNSSASPRRAWTSSPPSRATASASTTAPASRPRTSPGWRPC